MSSASLLFISSWYSWSCLATHCWALCWAASSSPNLALASLMAISSHYSASQCSLQSCPLTNDFDTVSCTHVWAAVKGPGTGGAHLVGFLSHTDGHTCIWSEGSEGKLEVWEWAEQLLICPRWMIFIITFLFLANFSYDEYAMFFSLIFLNLFCTFDILTIIYLWLSLLEILNGWASF